MAPSPFRSATVSRRRVLSLAAGAPDARAFGALREEAIAGEERRLGQLREVIRKHDYRFRGEPTGEETGAGERAVHHVVGAPGIGR